MQFLKKIFSIDIIIEIKIFILSIINTLISGNNKFDIMILLKLMIKGYNHLKYVNIRDIKGINYIQSYFCLCNNFFAIDFLKEDINT